MDFSNLQEPGDHSYTMTTSVFPSFHFLVHANDALPVVDAVFLFIMTLRGNFFRMAQMLYLTGQ